MTDINSTDYHDFVIKNGKLIGEFEQMYRKSKDVPWHQDEERNWLDVRLAVEMLREHSPFDCICDLGCGLGYFLNILKDNLAKPGCRTIGCEISPTCRKKAKALFPDSEFIAFDLRKKERAAVRGSTKKNLFSLRSALWYVFPYMKEVVENLAYQTKKDDLLLVSQNFPPLVSNFAGKEVIPGPEAVIRWLDSYFKPVKTFFLEDRRSDNNDNWFIGIFIRR
ncbi:MAG: class I SAM-dependent methyltransferase [Candidatus Omnitrophota bacterium]|nr:class I SAM-dependent methyltransferase [Candidatus Omnitrophota bacterium]